MSEKAMTIEELGRLEEIRVEALRLSDEVLRLYGKHFVNEEVMPLRRVYGSLTEAHIGINHFMQESATATKWRKENQNEKS